jgi:anti-sigma B factor antagonist
MSIEIEIKHSDNVSIISIIGRIDSNTSQIMEKKISELFVNNKYNLVADMSTVNYVSSAGLRVFLSTLKKTKGNGGNFKLLSLSGCVKEVFDMTGFTNLFDIYTEVDTAVNSFK